MIYRDEDRALWERRNQLQDRLRAAQGAEREARDARAEADAVARKSAAQGRRLPMLDDIRIASPCNVSWEAMTGDAQKRFCGGCQKNVFNLSEMTRAQAEEFLATQTTTPCVRLYMRADGTVLTTDCPKQRRKRIFTADAASMASMMFGALAWLGYSRTYEQTQLMGKVAMGSPPVIETPVIETATPPDPVQFVPMQPPIQPKKVHP